MSQAQPQQTDLAVDRPHVARMYDYYLGGTTNYPADREAAARAIAVFPSLMVAVRANRAFVLRSTRHLARSGLRQFLDLGSGIPSSPNLHEVAQEVAPESRVVYVDRDPLVLAHSQALLAGHPAGRTAYVHADVADPAALLASRELRDTLDLDRPVALSLNALLHFVSDDDAAYALVEQLKDALAPGSTLTLTHVTGDFAPEAVARLEEIYRASGNPGKARSREEFLRFFDGWELWEPGVTLAHRWRPDSGNPLIPAGVTDSEVLLYVGVARKP